MEGEREGGRDGVKRVKGRERETERRGKEREKRGREGEKRRQRKRK